MKLVFHKWKSLPDTVNSIIFSAWDDTLRGKSEAKNDAKVLTFG